MPDVSSIPEIEQAYGLKGVLEHSFERTRHDASGVLADYIPELAKADPAIIGGRRPDDGFYLV